LPDRPAAEKLLRAGRSGPDWTNSQMKDALGPLVRRAEGLLCLLLAEPERARRAYPAVLLLIGMVVWFPSLFTGLDLSNPDDFYHITQAALHHTPGDIADWFVRGYWAYTHYEYRPLTRSSLLLDYLIWGRRPFGFHLTNLLLHCCCALLLAAVIARARAPIWAARLSGLIAVVFPAGQMAVSWITGRQDLLCGALLLLGILLFLFWLTGRRWPYLLAAAVTVLLAALAKEPGAVAPLIMLAAVFLFPGRRSRAIGVLGAAAVGATVVAYLWLRFHAWTPADYIAGNAPQLRSLKVGVRYLFSDVLLPRPYELATHWRSMGIYLVFSPLLPRLLLEQAVFWPALLVLLRRQRRLLALGVVWKIALFLPVYNLYWNPAFKHYRYLPHLGTAWLSGLAAWELGRWSSARLSGRLRPVARWSFVAAGLLLLLLYYGKELDQKWPPMSLVARGGPEPPAAFCRDVHGPDAPFAVSASDPAAQ
jgi:hypothetical protein